ncbi:MAG TPA: glutathione S-transferase [Cyanobacteria bacterium UBA11049]|nr:glutathione S-transferase [Cyanobacteria bacterium UBA11049]
MAIASIPLSYKSALALPPASDIPEEVLRTEIILEARSPVDGKPLSAAQYAELQAQLQTRSAPAKLNPQVRDTIFLLRLRRTLRTFFPFLPI